MDEEEASFSRTLDRGERLFDQFAAKAKEEGKKELNGADVWRLYDTFGFPVDLTLLMAEEQGLGINNAEYEEAQKKSKEASKGGAKKAVDDIVKLDVHELAELEKGGVPKTDDSFKFGEWPIPSMRSEFTHPCLSGNDNVDAKVQVIIYDKKFHKNTDDIPEGANFGIVLDKTSFYAESGGQEYDTGNIVIDGVADFEVTNVQVYNGYVVHTGTLKYGSLAVDNDVISSYDELRRWPLRNNHTATHILNYSLREILGDHIDQKGSLVAPTKLRFDFSHKAQVALPELEKIEALSLDWIKRNVRVYGKELKLETAQKIPGLRAVFGETYPNPVRVVTLEYDVDDIAKDIENPKWRNTSVEFCGGT